MPHFNPDRLRRTPMMRGSSFHEEARKYFHGNDRFKAEKIARALAGGDSLYKDHQMKAKISELFEQAEERGLKLTQEGKDMKESLESGSTLGVKRLVKGDTKEQLEEIAAEHKGPSKDELANLAKREKMKKRLHQRETAEQRQAEEESLKKAATKKDDNSSSSERRSSAGAAPIGGNIPRRFNTGSSNPSYSGLNSTNISPERRTDDTSDAARSNRSETPDQPADDMAID